MMQCENTWPDIAGFEEGVREPWIKKCWHLLDAGEGKKMNFNTVTLILEFWPLELEENKFVLF